MPSSRPATPPAMPRPGIRPKGVSDDADRRREPPSVAAVEAGSGPVRPLRHHPRAGADDPGVLGPLAPRLPDGQQLHQRAEPGVAGDDHRRRADPGGDGRRAGPVDRLRRQPARRSGHRADRRQRPADPGRHPDRAGARRADRPGQRPDRHQDQGQFGDRHPGRRHHPDRPVLRLFRRRPDRRGRAGGLPADLARPLAVRHSQQHHHHGAGARRPVDPGRAHRPRAGDPGGRRQPGGGAPGRHQCRPHQDRWASSSPACARR